MRNSRLVCDQWSTHASILEHPERVMLEIHAFLNETARMKRATSTTFIRAPISSRRTPINSDKGRDIKNQNVRPADYTPPWAHAQHALCPPSWRRIVCLWKPYTNPSLCENTQDYKQCENDDVGNEEDQRLRKLIKNARRRSSNSTMLSSPSNVLASAESVQQQMTYRSPQRCYDPETC